MVEIRKTELFAKWIDNLRDVQVKARVLVRIERLASGNAGDVKPVGEGISEMRIDYGPWVPGLFHKTRQRIDHSVGRRRQRQSSQRYQDRTPPCTQSIGVENAKNRYQSL